MIIYHNDRPLKLIPKKYSKIPNIIDYLEDFENIRLDEIERKHLDMRLFTLAVENFMMLLYLSEPLVYAHIENAKPVAASRVKYTDGVVEYMLIMSNNLSVRCELEIYSLSPVKTCRTNVANKQLKCFES
ncbi:MAG: hypothetical protein JZU49_00215 [Sulfuricurvum sp.]|nr:hypothetical protein [Sulfuricurvum sp.]